MKPDFAIQFATLIRKPIHFWNRQDKADFAEYKKVEEIKQAAPFKFRIPLEAFPPIETVREGQIL